MIVAAVIVVVLAGAAVFWSVLTLNRITLDDSPPPRCRCGRHTLDDCEAVWDRDALHEATRCAPHRESV